MAVRQGNAQASPPPRCGRLGLYAFPPLGNLSAGRQRSRAPPALRARQRNAALCREFAAGLPPRRRRRVAGGDADGGQGGSLRMFSRVLMQNEGGTPFKM